MNRKNAIEVHFIDGFFHIPYSSQKEVWDSVKKRADKVEHRSRICGWGEYTDWYAVTFGGRSFNYFVTE